MSASTLAGLVIGAMTLTWAMITGVLLVVVRIAVAWGGTKQQLSGIAMNIAEIKADVARLESHHMNGGGRAGVR